MKLWNKGYSLNQEIEKFTVGDDFLLDKKLVKYDLKVNLAHAKMLHKLGILTAAELKEITQKLNQINLNTFEIEPGQEDVHTAIEEYLGELGKKIHTGKSRNDQVMADLLLYSKEELGETKKIIKQLAQVINEFAQKNILPMPGYTHMQKAMPYSVDQWILSFKEMLEDDLKLINSVLMLIDKSPMGSAAGFGVPLGLDKEMVAKDLGFSQVHQQALYVQNSKNKHLASILFSLNQLMLTLNKLASDLMLFTTSEFNYFSLPKEFCTGSSIMPQKKNYDVLELVRAKTASFQVKLNEIIILGSNLISGYHRDSQLVKKPLIEGIETAKSVINILALVISHLVPNSEKLKQAMTPELYATEKALNLVKKGLPFREAYQKVSQEFK